MAQRYHGVFLETLRALKARKALKGSFRFSQIRSLSLGLSFDAEAEFSPLAGGTASRQLHNDDSSAQPDGFIFVFYAAVALLQRLEWPLNNSCLQSKVNPNEFRRLPGHHPAAGFPLQLARLLAGRAGAKDASLLRPLVWPVHPSIFKPPSLSLWPLISLLRSAPASLASFLPPGQALAGAYKLCWYCYYVLFYNWSMERLHVVKSAVAFSSSSSVFFPSLLASSADHLAASQGLTPSRQTIVAVASASAAIAGASYH